MEDQERQTFGEALAVERALLEERVLSLISRGKDHGVDRLGSAIVAKDCGAVLDRRHAGVSDDTIGFERFDDPTIGKRKSVPQLITRRGQTEAPRIADGHRADETEAL